MKHLRLVTQNERPAMSQREYDGHISNLAWFCGGFLCALVVIAWGVAP